MHRSLQPLKPSSCRLLQQQWDQQDYLDHRQKVRSAVPVVDTRGQKTPVHIMVKPKRLQLQLERQAAIDHDNRVLASHLDRIAASQGLVDHRNQYQPRSLNGERRRRELQLVGQQNLEIHRRITARQSEYRRRRWPDAAEEERRRREQLSRFPRAAPDKKPCRKVQFTSVVASSPDAVPSVARGGARGAFHPA